ncbi:protein Spt23p [Diutina catenulata]
MTSSVEENILDGNFFSGLHHDDQDILDEFLDQRVYDSIQTTPVAGAGGIKLESADLLDFYPDDPMQPKQGEYMYDEPHAHQSSFVSPVKMETDPPAPANGSAPSNSQAMPLYDYEYIRDELTKLKFGNPHMNPCPVSVDVPDPSYIDFSPATMAKLPYKLTLSHLPSYSRVETQIKLRFALSPPPPQMLLRLPQDLISKNKFCLGSPVESLNPKLRQSMLFLDAYVLTADLKNSCNICSRCIKREQKRASRRKVGTSHDEDGANAEASSSWANEQMMKKALIFNCKEVMSFPPPNGLETDADKSLELSARIICYCRHHKETKGFKLLFVVHDANGNVVAKELSSPIMIMDRKKTSGNGGVKTDYSMPTSVANSSTNLAAMSDDVPAPADNSRRPTADTHSSPSDSMHGVSPHSFDESESQSELSHLLGLGFGAPDHGRKRKKLSIDDSLNTATNPMANGNFSPVSNSDTNTSTSHYMSMGKPGSGLGPMHLAPTPSQSGPQPTLPFIQRIIPAQGPIRGGIEVTLLGFNFRPGLAVKFGANQALATHCWSETTIVTYLPPAAQPGQVLVSFENQQSMMLGGTQQQQIFTYTDDTDRQLIELALQIVGLKMNGKLEDAKNIAKRIVGTEGSVPGSMANSPTSQAPPSQVQQQQWFDSAHRAVEQLVTSRVSTEEILCNFLALVDLPNCPILIPNWSLCNKQGQTALHFAALKGYTRLVKFLVAHGCKADVQDNQGITPLFLASMCGRRDMIDVFLECRCNWGLKLSNDRFLKDYCDPNVIDVFNGLGDPSECFDDVLPKRGSVDSLSSMMTMNYGRHVSKMVNEPLPVGQVAPAQHSPPVSDFADSEFESDDSDYGSDDANPVRPATTIAEPEEAAPSGLWQRVKNAFNNEEDVERLPSYDDLFPFGGNGSEEKPKSSLERMLNDAATSTSAAAAAHASDEDTGITSDSSEDMVVSYINHPRKTMENDKMLFFFWLPMLMIIVGLFFLGSVMGYRFESIEYLKLAVRNSLGNMMVGSDRIARVYKERLVG